MNLSFDKVLNLPAEDKTLQRRLDISFDKMAESFKQKDVCIITTTVDLTIGTGAFVLVNFNSIIQDKNTLYSITTPSRITIQTPGTYQINAIMAFSANATGYRSIKLAKNGVLTNFTVVPAVSTSYLSFVSLSVICPANLGDYFEVSLFQDTGGSLTTVVSGFPQFSVARVGD